MIMWPTQEEPSQTKKPLPDTGGMTCNYYCVNAPSCFTSFPFAYQFSNQTALISPHVIYELTMIINSKMRTSSNGGVEAPENNGEERERERELGAKRDGMQKMKVRKNPHEPPQVLGSR